MAALTSARNTPEMSDFGRLQTYPVEANTVVYLGSIVALNQNGNAVPASSAAGLRIVGRAERLYDGVPGQNADNTGGAAGAISLVCRRGVFLYADNDGSIAAAQVGALCYAVDDNSVSASDGSGAAAVAAQAVTLPASGAELAALGHENVSAVKVQSTSGGGTVYVEGTDYLVDYQSGLLTLAAGGAIAAGATVYASYRWGAATRSVAGTVANLDPSGEVWVDFWRQSALAV